MNRGGFEHLIVEKQGNSVAWVTLNRPEKRNALNPVIWMEIGQAFVQLAGDPDVRAVLLTGNGSAFTSGIDLIAAQQILVPSDGLDPARQSRALLPTIKRMQTAFQAITDCPKPVIAAIHGYCFGGGVDLISACDIRVATTDAQFSIKEVDIGLAADTGSINRLNKICGNDSWIREVAFTSRIFGAQEALTQGLISTIYATYDFMINDVTKLAINIASKSPVAVQGTKVILNYSRDHSVEDSLNFTATWNMSQLLTDDIKLSMMSAYDINSKPAFAKL